MCKERQSTESEAPRLQAVASRKGNVVLIVPLDPANKAGLAGHLPAKDKDFTPEAGTLVNPVLYSYVWMVIGISCLLADILC